jgi:metal-responsive CopG/Arc/MetJ family transcriptional regulator
MPRSTVWVSLRLPQDLQATLATIPTGKRSAAITTALRKHLEQASPLSLNQHETSIGREGQATPNRPRAK